MSIFLNDFEYAFTIKFGNVITNDFYYKFQRYALVILKPECLKTNKAYFAINILKNLNYMPIYISLKTMSQIETISLWKNQWKEATIPRVLLNCVAANWGESAIMILRDMNNINRDSCEYLNSLKGNSTDCAGNNEYIRGKLGTINNFLNFIHCADNTAEMIRELILLFDFKEIIELIRIIDNEVYLSEKDIKKKFAGKLDNCKLGNIDNYFDSFLALFNNESQNIEELNLYEQLQNAKLKQEISSDLFFSLYKNDKINWSWENLVLFTSLTNFID